ncbi:MAG: type II toxin-antitoxin system VapC family toxin [Deltaproteobacteria bacterium]|nr:type II toxin-antitoxin system VapC family toxin [Deltaproteobacteria bacterium]
MMCYLDSSVVLRKVFGEPKPLREWKNIKQAFSSRLLRIECLRTIDRLRALHQLSSEEVAERLVALQGMLSHIGILPLSNRVQDRAEQAFSLPLGTLDSLHLASAMLWRSHGNDFVFATHDEQLGIAAKAEGFKVIGI